MNQPTFQFLSFNRSNRQILRFKNFNFFLPFDYSVRSPLKGWDRCKGRECREGKSRKMSGIHLEKVSGGRRISRHRVNRISSAPNGWNPRLSPLHRARLRVLGLWTSRFVECHVCRVTTIKRGCKTWFRFSIARESYWFCENFYMTIKWKESME